MPACSEWRFIGPESHRSRPAVRFVVGLAPARQGELFASMSKLPRMTRAQRRPLESVGRRVLESRTEPRAKRPWVVRWYYESQAGEHLAAEFGGFTEAEAADAIAPFTKGQVEAFPAAREHDLPCPGLAEGDDLARHYPDAVGTCQATTWCACRGSGWVERPAPRVRRGYRLVVWPTERPERMVICGESDTGSV